MKKLVVRLKGGLGNQMFQYAAGRSCALNNDLQLVVDTSSGFTRDKTYGRTFSLDSFPLQIENASRLRQLPFWIEDMRGKMMPRGSQVVRRYPWGLYICEPELKYWKGIEELSIDRNAYLEGYWQSEYYFAPCRDLVGQELYPPTPSREPFLSKARCMEAENSIAVGVRRFEEVPGAGKTGVGGLVPYSFYEEAARKLASCIEEPVFYVFCITAEDIEGNIDLPGETHYLTHENGYNGELERLWLFSRCAHHIISNSSFYWWGAWLAEYQRPCGTIVASDKFTNEDCIPDRWRRVSTHGLEVAPCQ